MAVSKLSAKQPWTAVWTPGVNLVNFYNLYDSKGDVTISTPTAIPTTLDGPIQVVRYGALTINAALTGSYRCRGLFLLCSSLAMGAVGSFSLDYLGAAGSRHWVANKDIFVPKSITFTGKNTSYAEFLKWIRQTGFCIFDPSLYACPPQGMGDVQCDWGTWVPLGSVLLSAAGCGGGANVVQVVVAGYNGVGTAGGAGTLAPGGGGSAGSTNSVYGGCSGPGTPWSGGSPGGVLSNGSLHGGPAGSGLRPGGFGIIFCSGNATLASGHAFTSKGENATAAYYGCPGGGRIGLTRGGTLTGAFNGVATGGICSSYGANGGTGVATDSTFASMGWS